MPTTFILRALILSLCAASVAGGETTLFEKLSAEESGLRLVNPIDTSHPLKRLYVGGYACGGLAIGDVDGDGLADIFAVSGPQKNALYLQAQGKSGSPTLKFVDVTERVAGLDGGDLWGAGAALADIDGDGDLDIYICHHDAPNHLFINETQVAGEPVFTECGVQFGVAISDASFMPSLIDYDNDGDLDLFVLGYQFKDPRGRPKVRTDQAGNLIEEKGSYLPLYQDAYGFHLKEGEDKYYKIEREGKGRPTFADAGRRDYLMRNDGKRFTDVTESAGIAGLGVGNSATWFDYDGDRDLDLYIANDFKVADQFYQNNADGTFTDIVKDAVPHTTWFSMGSDVGDLNGDGMLDLLVSDMAGTTHYRSKVSMGEMQNSAHFLKTANPQQYMRNAVYLNTGTPRFLEAAYLTGMANTDWTWAVKLADYNNDGRVDVFFTNGSARMFNHSDYSQKQAAWFGKTEWDLWESLDERQEENLAFENQGDLKFRRVGQEWGLAEPSMSYACAHGDLDNDGDLDLLVANLNEPIALYQNHCKSNSVKIRLVSKRGKNGHGIGAKVRARVGKTIQALTLMPSSGFLSYNEPALHVGLGDADAIDELVIDWPGGGTQVIQGLAAGKVHVIEEDVKATPMTENVGHPLFRLSSVVPAVRHVELDHDDFAQQPLLPNKHSQLGPGMALGDVDGDGDDDFYMGRGRGGRRAIYTNDGGGKLTVKDIGPFQGEEGYEDLAALFFDADRDGDQDLYVVSGGVEAKIGDGAYRDRLYVNDGKGAFARTRGALPEVTDSGSVVVAGDLDRDGDLDLFVGGRVVPGAYPEVPVSRLLENQSVPGKPRFVDRTSELAKGLGKTGMVTSALWSDANGDGWLDLMVTHEWGPVKLYLNLKGTLVDRTHEAGLADALGWWNGIAGRDMDGDGDLDYLATNFGLNTKYKASPEKPELLYYGDFDGTGKRHLVEAKFEDGHCVPRRGLSCSSHAMPFVRKKVGTFHKFGMSNLQQIYSAPKLDSALRLEANTLESGWWVNNGRDQQGVPRFRFKPLPRLAQIAPSFGVVLTELDGDGEVDVFLAQNFYSPQVETGRMDGGLSLWLRGVGGGRFVPMGPRASGISVRGDAMGASLADFNQDNRPDLVVSVNNSVMACYENHARVLTRNRFLKVQLQGPPGNPTCVGARVRLRFADETKHRPQLAEMQAGGSYLSQSTAALFFGCGRDAVPASLEVFWPNGKGNRYPLKDSEGTVRISMP